MRKIFFIILLVTLFTVNGFAAAPTEGPLSFDGPSSGSAAACTWQEVPLLAGAPDAFLDDGIPRNWRIIVPANTSSYSGSKIRITIKTASTVGGTMDNASIGLMTTGNDFDGTGTVPNSTSAKITWSASDSVIIATAMTEAVSDAITFAFDKTLRYGIHLYVHARHFVSRNAGETNTLYYDTNDINEAYTLLSLTALTNDIPAITKFEVCTP